jgi:hypothetical protein
MPHSPTIQDKLLHFEQEAIGKIVRRIIYHLKPLIEVGRHPATMCGLFAVNQPMRLMIILNLRLQLSDRKTD